MIQPAIGQTIRFIDCCNGLAHTGVVERPNVTSHFDYPVWDVRVTVYAGTPVKNGPLLSVTAGEVVEVLRIEPDILAGWRPVCARRARKLRKRGETVEWRPALHRFAWLPGGRS